VISDGASIEPHAYEGDSDGIACERCGYAPEFAAHGSSPRERISSAPPRADYGPPAQRPPADLLDELESFLRRFVVFGNEQQASAVALWIASTWAVEAAEATPYLAITSAEKRSGKSRLLEVLELLVRSPLMVSSTSEAALFRTVASGPTTLLFDEADAVFSAKAAPNDGLRALLNAGHRRGATVARMGGANYTTLQRFDVFCPKALAGIGALPPTVADRSIPIRLTRRTPAEPVERFRRREAASEARCLRDALAAWLTPNLKALGDARPSIPTEINDRAQDGWEPLLALADLAGGSWPQKARTGALELHGATSDEDPSYGVRLLADIRGAFEEHGSEAMFTADLLAALVAVEDERWAEWWEKEVVAGRTKGPASQLSRRLKPYGIGPTKLRVGERVGQGYRRASFADAWARYLPAPVPDTNSEHGTPQVSGPEHPG